MKAHRLSSQVLPVREIDADCAAELYRLFAANYDHVTPSRFESDLAEKDFVVVLRDVESGVICGFSTQQILHLVVDGQPIRALFSGDTIIDPDYWGEQELVRGWCCVVGQLLAEDNETPLYWLLISKGFRTYLYLPVFFCEYWPRHDRETPSSVQRILDALAKRKWPDAYDSSSGLLRFPISLGQLKPAIAAVPVARQDDPDVRFFLQRNATYLHGTELVCLAPISISNTKSIGRRLIQQAVSECRRQREEHGV